MMIVLMQVLGWLSAFSLFFAPILEPNRTKAHARLEAVLKELHWSKADILTRLHRISKMFLDVPYGRKPGLLKPDRGESKTIRFEYLDCTTFLEQAMALTLSDNLAQAEAVLVRIRYIDGIADYAHRKHFMMAQWIPMNQKEGFIEDITCRIGKDSVKWVSKRLDPQVWRKRKRKDRLPRLDPGQIPVGTYRLPVIPREKMLAMLDAIPAGVILNVVRMDYQSIPYRVSHQGLVVRRKGKTYIRHAARVGYARVVDEPLEVFFKRNLAYTRWPVAGINLQAIIASGGSASPSKDKTR